MTSVANNSIATNTHATIPTIPTMTSERRFDEASAKRYVHFLYSSDDDTQYMGN